MISMTIGEICEFLQNNTKKYWGFVSENEFVASYEPFPTDKVEHYTYEQAIKLVNELKNN